MTGVSFYILMEQGNHTKLNDFSLSLVPATGIKLAPQKLRAPVIRDAGKVNLACPGVFLYDRGDQGVASEQELIIEL